MIKYILFLSAILLTLGSCETDNRSFEEVRIPSQFNLPAGLNTIEAHFFVIREVPTLYKQKLQQFGIRDEDVTNVQSTRGRVLQTLSNLDLDFISSITIDVVSRENPNLRAEMYYNEQITLTQGPELRMLSSTSELQDLLKDDLVDLEVRLTFRRFPPTNVRLDLDLGYAIYTEI